MDVADEENLESFIAETDEWIDTVLSTLGWTREHILQRGVSETCPINSSHHLPASVLNKHIECCSTAHQKDSSTDLTDDSHRFFYGNAKKVAVIPLDEAIVRQVLSGAAASDEMDVASLSPQQRFLLYQHCITSAKSVNQETSIPEEQLQLLEDKTSSGKTKSSLELKAEERDMKRRRQSYKNKAGVSTRNKTHTQLIREVITSQTELLAQLWREEEENKQREERRGKVEGRRGDVEERHSRRRSRDRSRHRTRERSRSSHRSHSSRHESRHIRSRSREDSAERKSKHKKHKKHKHKHHKEHKKDRDHDSAPGEQNITLQQDPSDVSTSYETIAQ